MKKSLCAVVALVAVASGAMAESPENGPFAPDWSAPEPSFLAPPAPAAPAPWVCISDSPTSGVDLALPPSALVVSVDASDRIATGGPGAFGLRSGLAPVGGEREVVVWASVAGVRRQVYASRFLNRRVGEAGRRLCARVSVGAPDGICPGGGLTVEMDERRASVLGDPAPEAEAADASLQPVATSGGGTASAPEGMIQLDREYAVFPCLDSLAEAPVVQ